MTKEDIEECLKFAENWHYTPGEPPTMDLYYICPVNEGSVYAVYLNEDMSVRGGYYHYKSFLQDVIEGINRKGAQNPGINQPDCKYVIVQYGAQILVATGETEEYFTHRSKDEEKAKEQAIIYVLNKIKENK